MLTLLINAPNWKQKCPPTTNCYIYMTNSAIKWNALLVHIDKSQMLYAKSKKLGSKSFILYDFIYMKFWNRQN